MLSLQARSYGDDSGCYFSRITDIIGVGPHSVAADENIELAEQ